MLVLLAIIAIVVKNAIVNVIKFVMIHVNAVAKTAKNALVRKIAIVNVVVNLYLKEFSKKINVIA